PDPVDRPVARGRHDPGAGVVRDPRRRPAIDRRRERVLYRVLGALQVAEDAGQDGDAPRPFLCIDRRQPIGQRTINGRISSVPYSAAGTRAAMRIASSRSGRSVTKIPPSCSFVSANGPSVTIVSPSTTRTTLAVDASESSRP